MSLIWKVWLPLLCWDLNSPPKNSIPLIFKCFRFVHFSLVIELISIAKTFPWPIPPTKAKKRMKQWAWNGSLKWFHSLFANFLQLIEFEQFHLPSLEQKSDLVFYCFGLGFTHGQFWSSLGFIQPWFRQCPLGATFSMYTIEALCYPCQTFGKGLRAFQWSQKEFGGAHGGFLESVSQCTRSFVTLLIEKVLQQLPAD